MLIAAAPDSRFPSAHPELRCRVILNIVAG